MNTHLNHGIYPPPLIDCYPPAASGMEAAAAADCQRLELSAVRGQNQGSRWIVLATEIVH